jgi:hypothetical protein
MVTGHKWSAHGPKREVVDEMLSAWTEKHTCEMLSTWMSYLSYLTLFATM